MIATRPTFYGRQQRPAPPPTTTATAAVDHGRVAAAAGRQVARGAAGQEELFGRDRKGRDDGDRRRSVAAVPTTTPLGHRQEIVQSLQVTPLFARENRLAGTKLAFASSVPTSYVPPGSFQKKKKLLIRV